MECKTESNGKRYCKINGEWVEIKNEKKFNVSVSSKTPIKVSRNTGKRTGVC